MMETPLTLQASENQMKFTSLKNEEKRLQERRENLLYLILHFLRVQGLSETSETLSKEADLSPDITLCDNIDLETIFASYSDAYVAKLNKLPKICKKISPTNISEEFRKAEKRNKVYRKKAVKENQPVKDRKNGSAEFGEIFELTGTKILDRKDEMLVSKCDTTSGSPEKDTEKFVQPIERFYPADSEFRKIADVILHEIISSNVAVSWNDICGLEECKILLQEAIIYPLKYPNIFGGKFSSWRGILLYGPPGTGNSIPSGKTMLARAVATECKWTFFNITASSLISKWRGDSEKYIRVLCDLAKIHAPSIIFIDEIDWTVGDNEYTGKQSEPARRFRSEFLARLDGLISMEKCDVILLATTNVPWNLDSALLRRFEKHILVDLPNESARREILKYYTSPSVHSDKEFEDIITETEYYSGSDLKRLCKEAWMIQMRMYIAMCDEKHKNSDQLTPPELINSISLLREAQQSILPTTKHLSNKYKDWAMRMNKNPSVK